MKIGDVIYDVLKNDGDVSALVGLRIYPIHAPQGSDYPLITYKIDNGAVFNGTKDGASTLDFIPIVVGCFASDTYEAATDLAEKVRSALEFYSGTVAGITISNVTMDDYEDDFDTETDEFYNIMDFTMAVKR